jgi:hypothetical protein
VGGGGWLSHKIQTKLLAHYPPSSIMVQSVYGLGQRLDDRGIEVLLLVCSFTILSVAKVTYQSVRNFDGMILTGDNQSNER